jgi:zinc transporter ZupT
MLSSGNTLKASMSMLLLDAIAPVSGAVTTFFFIQDNFIVFALSFLAGSFAYTGSVSLLPESHRKNRPIVTLVFFLVGFILIFLPFKAYKVMKKKLFN